MDERHTQLRRWLASQLAGGPMSLTPASADASFRRYFRVKQGGRSLIAMDAPPDREDTGRFEQVASLLGEAGLHVPGVLSADRTAGFLLLSDLGDTTYLAALADGVAPERLYRDALDALLRMQSRADPRGLPPYDEALLRQELRLFETWYLERHLGREPDGGQRAGLRQVEDFLVAESLRAPRVFVHRDYHSRNLMVSEPNPGILDFQDAVLGPQGYDLASLLRDCYVTWPADRVAEWTAYFESGARRAGLPLPPEGLRRAMDLTGVQRHLKAIGIFARLCHRDGKPGYLDDVPRVLAHLRSVVPEYRELDALGVLLEGLDEAPGERAT